MRYREIQDYYDSRYNIDGDDAFAVDSGRLRAQLAPLLSQLGAGSAILDVGCGVGFACAFLAQRGYSVTGVDISEEALARAQKRVRNGTFQTARENGSLPFPDEAFDGIACIGVLEHIPETEHALEACFRVLKRGGIATFVVPNSRSPYFLTTRGTGQVYEETRTRAGWERLFSAAGFTTVGISKDPGPRISRSQPLIRNVKLVAHRVLNALPVELTYQFVFALQKL